VRAGLPEPGLWPAGARPPSAAWLPPAVGHRFLSLLVYAALLAALIAPPASASPDTPDPPGLRAGLGVAPLPTRLGAPLGGYGGFFDRTARSVHDLPEARALILEGSGQRIALLTLDIVIARPEITQAIRERVGALGLDALVLAATHTHSGPGGYIEGFLAERITSGHFEASLRDAFVESAAKALGAARDDLREVTARAIEREVGLAEHRRRPGGPRETQLPILLLEPTQGGRSIVVLGFGAHPTVFSPRSRAFSADYVGAARAALEARGLRALFLPGPMGDQRPKSELGPLGSRDLELQARQAAEIGAKLAAAVVDPGLLARTSEPSARAAKLEFYESELELPELQLRRFCALWWFSPLVRGPASRLLSDRVPLQLVRLGPASLLAIPAEPGTELGDRFRQVLERAFPGSVGFVVAHANDWAGYLVTAETYRSGGYEACLSFRGPKFADLLVEAASELAASIHQAQRH